MRSETLVPKIFDLVTCYRYLKVCSVLLLSWYRRLLNLRSALILTLIIFIFVSIIVFR